MLKAALMFLVLAVFAYILGVTGYSAVSIDVGRILLVVFMMLAVLGVVVGMISGGRHRNDLS